MGYLDLPTDNDGLFAKLCAKLDLSIGSTNDLTRELKRPRKRQPAAQPVFGRVRGSVTVANGVGVITFDQPGPEQGYFWYVRSLVIGGLTPTTTAAGRADVYVTAMILNQSASLASLGLSDWRDQASSLPDVSFYGRGELPLRHNENLAILLSSATNGQQYAAVCQFEQYQEAPQPETWDL